MLLDIDTLRVRIGLPVGDTTRDAEITMASDMAMAFLESYCDRKFAWTTDHIEQFAHIEGESLSLELYPINVVKLVDGITTGYHIDRRAGLLLFDSRVRAHEVRVTYDGGFAPALVPGDLAYAFLTLFDMAWGQVTATVGAGGGLGAGVVKSVASAGARVEFFDPTSGGASAVGVDEDSGLPSAVVGLLANYRREKA